MKRTRGDGERRREEANLRGCEGQKGLDSGSRTGTVVTTRREAEGASIVSCGGEDGREGGREGGGRRRSPDRAG